ncbi:MAG: InlB B-repeat-containing protein, partial [Suilimivivens sp.]
ARYAPIGETMYHVTFMDWNDTVLDEQDVVAGKGAKTPPAPTREGYNFTGWRPGYDNITSDVIIYAQYEKIDSDDTKYTVTFYNYDDTVVSVQKVGKGESAVEPVHPTREGYVFEGWKPASYANVTKDLDVYAQFVPVSPNAASTSSPNETENSKATPTPQIIYQEPAKQKYTVSVSGGSGSGSYAAGDIVAINAYYMGSGQVFDKWTTSTAGVGFANSTASSTTFTMPATNVAITATYKTGSSSSANTGGSGDGTSNTGGTSSGVTNTGTTVEVTKPGISNTGLAGATVTGATDNFVVKVTEDQSATDAAIAALQARYGDLSRIKYLPMDISLYDSTGRTKIADTTGISVNITLPIPDDLVQYAGNNKIAAITNGALEDLNARFTTVDGVPCINFTATHFSPYVVYVDTANLTAGAIDATPKTGDPIHPKWFLAIGMACISLILFFKKDKSGVRTKIA